MRFIPRIVGEGETEMFADGVFLMFGRLSVAKFGQREIFFNQLDSLVCPRVGLGGG